MIGREDRHASELAHFLREIQQAGRLNAVIVCHEDMHK
jgi:hypothetical protein